MRVGGDGLPDETGPCRTTAALNSEELFWKQ